MADDRVTGSTIGTPAGPAADLGPRKPLWRSVQAALEDEIRRRVIAPGEKLPTEEELALRFRVHRHTVRRALARLRDKRLLRVEQGLGSFVEEAKLFHRLNRKARLSGTVVDLGRVPRRVLLRAEDEEASAEIAGALYVPRRHPVRHVETLRLVDDEPVALTSHFFPLPRFRGIDGLIEQHGSVSAALRDLGVADFTHHTSRITARNPTARQASQLKQPRSRPVLHVVNVIVDPARTPVQLTRTSFAAQRMELVLSYEP